MKTYSLRRAANLLGIHRSTLRRWLSEEKVAVPRSKGDSRRRLLTTQQIAALASLHGRIVSFPADESEDRLASLELRVAQLEELMNKKSPPDLSGGLLLMDEVY